MNKKIFISIFIILITILIIGVFFIITKTKNDIISTEAEMKMISKYCYNLDVNAVTNEYIERGSNNELAKEIIYLKFDYIWAEIYNSSSKYWAEKYRNEYEKKKIENILVKLCEKDKHKTETKEEFFWYKLDDNRSITGLIERKVPTSIAEREIGDRIRCVVIENDTNRIINIFSFSPSVEDSGLHTQKYKKVTKKDIKNIVNLILEDKAYFSNK